MVRPAWIAVLLALAVPALAAPPDVIVMIHGAGGGGWEYEKWAPTFEKAGWKVVHPDLVPVRGGLAATRFEDYIAQVKSWVPREHGRLVIAGASMGGILALKAAEALEPDALVLANSVPPAGVGARKPTKFPAVIRWANGPLKDTRDAMPDSDESTILRAHPRWRDESGKVMTAITDGVKVRKPACPTLVILGEKDTDVPMANGLALARWSGADIHLYHATSHVGPLLGRRAPEIAEAARRWVDGRTRR